MLVLSCVPLCLLRLIAGACRKQALSIAPNKYGLAYGGYYQISTHVLINAGDGSVAVTCGGAEIGQGLDTKLAQVGRYFST